MTLTSGEIKTGSPISYTRMTEKITITEQDKKNFIKQLYLPHGKTGHWYYLGSIRNSRGMFKTEHSGKVKPYYFTYQAAKGLPPEGKDIVLRKCLDEVCVNPEHFCNYTVKEVKELKEVRKRRVEAAKQLEEFKKITAQNNRFYEALDNKELKEKEFEVLQKLFKSA